MIFKTMLQVGDQQMPGPGDFKEITYKWSTRIGYAHEPGLDTLEVAAEMIQKQMANVVDRCLPQIEEELKRIFKGGTE